MSMSASFFTSQVPEQGFTWVQGPFRSGSELLASDPASLEDLDGPALARVSGEMRAIELPPDLFLQFNRLKPSPKEILQFAGAYGALGTNRRLATPREEISGELLSSWSDQIRALKAAIEVYEAIKTSDHKTLAELVPPAGDRQVEYVSSKKSADGKPLGSATMLLAPRSRALQDEEDILRAKIYLQQVITGQFDRFVRIRPMWTKQFAELIETIAYRGLAGVMWKQLEQAVCDDCSFVDCAGCEKVMLVVPGGLRADRKTCSDVCRVRVYQRRKAQARELSEKGMRPSEIASKLNADLSAVRSWIKTPPLKRKPK